MSIPQHNLSPWRRRLAAFWGTARQGWRAANRATRNTLTLLFKLLALAYFLFATLVLVLRYGVLPNIEHYKPSIEQAASRALGRPVAAGGIQADWRGLRPHLSLNDVVVRDAAGQPALVLPRVSAVLSWTSVVQGELRLQRLEIERPEVAIRRDRDGILHVAGLQVDLASRGGGSGDSKGMDWFLSQDEVVVRDGRLRWHDELRGAPELALEEVHFLMRNDWRRHRFALRATPPAALAQPIDIRADFRHPAFADRISDVSRWEGELYADLQGADLAAWTAYVDYPVEVTRGQGAVRAWLQLDHARVADFSADLSLDQVQTRLREDLQPLDLTQVDGRIAVREEIDAGSKDGRPTFGAQGHAISLTDFSFRTSDGLVFPSTTLTERYTPAGNGKPEKFEVSAKLLDLHTLAAFAGRLPLPAGQRRMLADFQPQGRLLDFSAQWQGSYPALTAYRIKGNFAGLGMRAQPPRPAVAASGTEPAHAAMPAIPGFVNLSGAVDASEKGGNFRLASSKLQLDLPGYFSAPLMLFDKLDMQAGWTFTKDEQLLLKIARMEFVQEGIAGSISGQHLMPLQAHGDKPLGQIDLVARIAELDISRVGRYLPLQMPADAREWLSGGLQGGKGRNLDLRLKGNLAEFPFDRAPADKRNPGIFTVSGDIVDGRLNYTPGEFAANGKAPLWPLLEEIQGTILFDRTRMEIKADSARTGGAALSHVRAVIPDLVAGDPVLTVDGQGEGELQSFIGYANASPVAGWIGKLTEASKGSGNASLALYLRLPLNRPDEAEVRGTLEFLGNDVTLFPGLPVLTGARGTLEFSERGINMPAVNANFLGGTTTLTGTTRPDGTIVIQAGGRASADGIRKAYADPAMRIIGQRLSGGTRYTAQVTVGKGGKTDITVESGLQGLGMDLPAPLNKAAATAMPLRLDLISTANGEDGRQRDEIALTAGSAIAVYYQREKTPGPTESWRVLRGGIGINTPAPRPESGVIASINVPALNLDAWTGLASSLLDSGAAPAGAPARSGVSGGASLGLAQYLEPEVLAVRATELIVAGRKLDDVVVGASHQDDLWQANIDSVQASGYITWRESRSGRGMGKVTARLASLVVPESAASDISALLDNDKEAGRVPALDITAENFELFGKRFGQLELQANNMRPNDGVREWRISKLRILNPDGELQASGSWTQRGKISQSSLDYSLDIVDAGKLLDRFGFTNVLRRGAGKMEGNLRWNGSPFQLDIPSLDGALRLDIGAGQFLKADPAAAKLLGLMSLQSMPRRLSLDFRDVFSEGFAFDGVVGSATITQGVARTDNFKMRGVSATVLMDGTADIARERADLHVVVIPEINAGAASVVYGLAVNPVIGLGTFMAQLFLRAPLMKAFTFEYRITGPWMDPVVTKIPRKNELAAGAPAATAVTGSAQASSAPGIPVPALPPAPAPGPTPLAPAAAPLPGRAPDTVSN